ncbi:MAG: apolipoprotein N-acyltransferase [Bacteroidota bacterium]|jgi:apolipoprotein N-acyltransferase
MPRLKNSSAILLSVLSGFLFWIAWAPNNFSAALFFAFIPLFIIEEKEKNSFRFFLFLYLGLFTWNMLTTWWIWHSTMIGAWLAIAVNSLLMFLPWWGYRKVKQQYSLTISLIAFIFFWLSFEYLHQQDWGLSWPWLTIGNAFAERTSWIQWYEFTGTSGGSLWALLINVFLYRAYIQENAEKPAFKTNLIFITTLILPIIISAYIEQKETKQIDTASKDISDNIVVVQPNIDPYEKINSGNLSNQINQLLELSKKQIDSNTTLLVWPETALFAYGGIDESRIRETDDLNPIFKLLKQYPKLHLFTGIECYRIFPEKHSIYSRPIDASGNFYEMYNGTMLADSSGALQFYHKSMLVPGVETLPRFLLFLGPVFEKFGGTAGGYARQEIRTTIPVRNHHIIAPAICYESIYGEYMSRYIKNGANLIAIITNDGWWGNTAGHKQHLAYARLRAIETRKWVVRSANTGISCFINPAGNIIQQAAWWQPDALKASVYSDNRETLFVKYGDIISKIALVMTALMICFYLFKSKLKSQKL